MEYVDEHGDDRCVDWVDDERADEGDDEEGRRCRAEEFGHGCHVGDGVRRSAQAEAADAAGHDGCFVVLAHGAEDDEVSEDGHEQGLAEEHDDQGDGQVGELPELEAHEDAGQKDGQAQVAQDFAFALVDFVGVREVGDVADDGGDNHGADIAREDQADAAEEAADQGAQAHGQEEVGHGVHEAVVVDGLADFIFNLNGVFCAFFIAGDGFERRNGAGIEGRVEAFRFGRADEVEFVDQFFANRAADDTAGDEAERSCCDGNGRAAVEADAFQERAESRCRTVAADHGDGPRCQAQERAQVKGHGQAGADDVLTDDQNCSDNGHFQDHDAAALDEADAGRIADAGEEEHHADVLHDRILFVFPDALRI